MVQAGDSLYQIGKRFGVDYHLLSRRNRIAKPYTVYVGQRIYLTKNAPISNQIPIPHSPQVKLHHPRIRTTVRHPTVVTPPSKAHKKMRAKHVTHPRRARKHHRVPPHRAHEHRRTRHAIAKGTGNHHLHWPVHGVVTSKFGPRGSRMHDGIDIGAKIGTSVTAAAAGEVVYSDHRLTGYGNLIIIRHSSDLFTAYAHNQRNIVHRGDRVHSGQVIAKVGKTGRATGPHLHFEVRRGTTPVDPLLYLPKQ